MSAEGGERGGGEEKWGDHGGRESDRGCEKRGRGATGLCDGTSTSAGGAGLMKSVCPVKVKINWRSGDGYRDNQPRPVVFKPSLAAHSIALFFVAAIVFAGSTRELFSKRDYVDNF